MFSNDRIIVYQIRMHYILLIEQLILQRSGPKLVKVNLTIKGQFYTSFGTNFGQSLPEKCIRNDLVPVPTT